MQIKTFDIEIPYDLTIQNIGMAKSNRTTLSNSRLSTSEASILKK